MDEAGRRIDFPSPGLISGAVGPRRGGESPGRHLGLEQTPVSLPQPQPYAMDLLATDARHRRGMAADATSRFLTLLPFLVSCVLYFALWLQEPSWLSTCVKTLPVLSLSFFLWAQGLKEGAWTPLAYWVCQGLLCSSVGDACLVWPQLFPLGMAAFALAHTCYLWALGLRPLLPLLALALALVWVGGYRLLSPCLKGPSVPAVGGYGALLVAVAWRALAHPAPHLALAAGSLFFIASDLVLALDHFCAPVPHVHLLVMATYYTAQFLIAVGASLATPHHKES